MAENLDGMKYHDAGGFVADVRLIFENAKQYNPSKHPIHLAAVKLSKVRKALDSAFVFRRDLSVMCRACSFELFFLAGLARY